MDVVSYYVCYYEYALEGQGENTENECRMGMDQELRMSKAQSARTAKKMPQRLRKNAKK